jgi:hypothetical protein
MGWDRIRLYRAAFDPASEGEGIADPAEREAVVTRTKAWLDSLDYAKARGFPLGVAALVVGSAILVFAMRTLGGNSGARTALVQLIVAQSLLTAADDWLLRDAWEAQTRMMSARWTAIAHERGEPAPAPVPENAPLVPIMIGLESLASAFVVVGLTRPRSRRFLEARAEAVGEP